MKNNQIGIIGLGYWGTNIVNVLIKIGCNSIHCYDINQENLKEIKKKFPHINIINKFNDFLDLKLDGVIISTSTNSHYQIAKKCLNKNHNIFLEKPVTNSVKKLNHLNKIANKNNKILMSGYIYFYNNHIQYIDKILNKNTLGKILYVSFERSNLGPVRNDISASWDLSSHDISICNYLFKKKLKILSSSGHDILKKGIKDICTISAKIDDIKIDFKSSWLNPEKIRKIVIVGKKKMLLFDEMNFKQPIKIYNKYASYPKTFKFNKKFFTQKANIYLGLTRSPKIKSKSPLENEMSEFLRCIKRKTKPKTSHKISLQVLKILQELN